MEYFPRITDAKPRKQFRLSEKHTAVLLGDIKALGSVEYLYVLIVYDETENACFFVASEVNDMAGQLDGGGSHFLGVMDGSGHANMGASDRWGIEEVFTAQALEIALEKFGNTEK